MAKSLARFEAGAEINDIATALNEDGGIIMLNLVTPELLDEVYDEVLANTSELERKAGGDVLWPEGNKTVGALAAISPSYVEKLLLHPKILEIADAILKPEDPMSEAARERLATVPEAPVDESTTGYYDSRFLRLAENDHGAQQMIAKGTDSESGPNCHHYNLGASVMLEVCGGADHQFLHRENAIYQPYIGYIPQMREFILSVNWAGSDFTRENGATRVVPGSHHWDEERFAKQSEVTQAEMPKGSAVVWLSRTLHGSGASSSDEGRRAFFASYIADWVRQEENQYVTVPPEIAAKLSDAGQRIIGYRCSPNLGWVKGRDQENLLREGKSSPL